jgi:putative Ca2+/H+ antiporter (TMEM165/GDT1 family)
VIGATTAWYYQVAFVVVGHVAALILAHDRALVTYDKARLAVRSQYWMLVVMVGFTTFALWLLAQSNG